jgi:hypothetical protein
MSLSRARGVALAAIVACGATAGAGAAFARTVAVPWFAQKSASDCGRAVLASLAARRGGSAEAAYRKLPEPPDRVRGYSIRDMQRFGSRVGVSLSVSAPAGLVIAGECSPRPAVSAHFKRLAGVVAGGRPVVVPVSQGLGAGHYLVLVGADGGNFTALDPASPGLRQIGSAALASRMCGYGYIALIAN